MRRAVLWIVVSAGAALVLAGCGGTKKYSLAPTRACLEKDQALTLNDEVDFVASTAVGGAVSVVFGKRNEVTISFADDRDEAARLVLGYQRFAGKNIGLADVLRPQKNAVLLWEAHPSDEDAGTISHCLK